MSTNHRKPGINAIAHRKHRRTIGPRTIGPRYGQQLALLNRALALSLGTAS